MGATRVLILMLKTFSKDKKNIEKIPDPSYADDRSAVVKLSSIFPIPLPWKTYIPFYSVVVSVLDESRCTTTVQQPHVVV